MNLNADLTKPLTDDELNYVGVEVVNDQLALFDLRDVPNSYAGLPMLLIGPVPVPKIMNLLQAAPHMYQALGRHYSMLQSVIDHLESTNALVKKQTGEAWGFAEGLANTFTQMQTELLNARRVACVGPLQVAEEMRRG